MIVPCHDAPTDSPPVMTRAGARSKEATVSTSSELSNSLIDPEEPFPQSNTANEKQSHKVLQALDKSPSSNNTDKQQAPVYSKQGQDYLTFTKQMYAPPPQEQDYLSFLQDLEKNNVSMETSVQDFAEWLEHHNADNDILPSIALEENPNLPPPKRVAFSKETTVRFFSRTREELMQLRKRYKKTIRGQHAVDDEDDEDEDDWPFFKYLDEKLKNIEESNAWDDPMAAMRDMFGVSKEMQKKWSPIMCVSCEDQTTTFDGDGNQNNENDKDRSLADLDEDEDLGPALALASARAAANNDLSFESQESGTPALWFAASPKNPGAKEPEGFLRPNVVSPIDHDAEETKSDGTPESQNSSADGVTTSPPRIVRETPQDLSAVLSESDVNQSSDDAAAGSVSADPEAPKKTSLSWLAEDLDSREEGGIPMLFDKDPLNDSALSRGNNTTASSLGRNTHSKLLRRVSEHLNPSGQSLGTDGNAAKTSLEPDGTQPDSSEKQTVSVTISELDDLIRSTDKKLLIGGRKNASIASPPEGDGIESHVSSDGSASQGCKGPSIEQKKRVVTGAKRWNASSKTDSDQVSQHTSADSLSYSTATSTQRMMEVVNGAKRWTASQRAESAKPNDGKERVATPFSEDEVDVIDGQMPRVAHGVNESFASSLWDGVASPVVPSDSKYVNDERASTAPSDEGQLVFRQAAAVMDPWLSADHGPDLDESKPWDAFEKQPDITTTTCGTASHDLDVGDEWVDFSSADNSLTAGPSLDEPWAAFPADEQPQAAAPKSPKKKVRTIPSKKSSRIQELASKFEARAAGRTPSPPKDNDVSPLTPSTPWADSSRNKKEAAFEYPDLQQPVLEESISTSDGSSPISVTHLNHQ